MPHSFVLESKLAQLAECTNWISAEGVKLPQKQCTVYDFKLHLIARLELWRCKECEVPLQFYNIQVHFDQE